MKAKPINILVDCHVLDGTYQGTTTYIKGIYKEAVKRKDFIFYFAADDLTYAKQAFGEAENIKYIKYPVSNKLLRLLFIIPGLIKKYRIDYAHFQYIVPPIKLCKYINTIHDVLFMDYPEFFPETYIKRNKFLFRWSAKRSDIIATVSGYSAVRLAHHFEVESIVTPNAVDSLYYEPYDRSDIAGQVKEKFGIDKYWLYVSRWEPRKNHHTLLQVFAENNYYTNYHLVLVGYNDIENKEFTKLYNSLSPEVKSKVLILGGIDLNDLILLTRGAAVSVYPSLAEGFGIPPLESAAVGIPTACSNATAMSDFVLFGDTLFNPYSASQMRDAIKVALEKGFSTDLKLEISKKYNWELSANILLDAITKNSVSLM